MRRLADWAGKANPPSPSIWLAVDKYLLQSHEAIRAGDLERAVALTKEAAAALRSAQWEWSNYKDQNLRGAEDIKTGAEDTRDAAKYSLIVLATAASGGAAAVAVATAGGIAIDLADVISRAALGEPINWGEVTAQIAVDIVTTKFGGRLTGGILKAVESNPAAQSLERRILMQAVDGVVKGAESRTLGAFIRSLFAAASTDRQPMTWDEFIDQVTNPTSVVIDVVLGVGRGLQAQQAGARTAPKDKKSPATQPVKKSDESPVTESKPAGAVDEGQSTVKPSSDVEMSATAKNLSRNELLEPTVRSQYHPQAATLSAKSAGFDFAEGQRTVSAHTTQKGGRTLVEQRIAGGKWTQLKIVSATTDAAAIDNTKVALERAENALKGVPKNDLEIVAQGSTRRYYEKADENLKWTRENAFERISEKYSYKTAYARRPDEVVIHLHFENVDPGDTATLARLEAASRREIDASPHKEDLPPVRTLVTGGRLDTH
jgi:hypothetical protein